MAVVEDVYCTLCMSDNYLPGAAVLAKSLRDTGTTRKLAVLIDQERLRPSTVTELQSLYNYTIPIERIGNPNPANLYLMNRPDLLYTFTKINLWRMTQFRKIIYVDSDIVALRAPDELFNIEEDFAAVPDVGWPDAFNTGVMVLAPNMGDYWALRTLAAAGDSFDGADQGLLNQYYEHRPWKRLSFVYNCTPSANYQYEPAYRYYKRDISMVHFIGSEKPWQQSRWKGGSGAYQELIGRWWAVYDRHFKVSTAEYISGQRERSSEVVRREVRSEQQPAYYATGYPPELVEAVSQQQQQQQRPQQPPQQYEPQHQQQQYQQQHQQQQYQPQHHQEQQYQPQHQHQQYHAPLPPEEQPASAVEIPFTEPGEEAENIDQGLVEPTPTVEVRRFSAPHAEWDATRAAPPPESKPEAVNFPTTTYEFSEDPEPFVPPAAYPEPPKGLWYEVPEKKEEKLAPLFPWEERAVPRPTRRFVEEEKAPTPESELEFAGADELEVSASPQQTSEPATPVIQINDQTPWSAFTTSSKNAWDEIAGIEKYVRALTASQRNRGKLQVLRQDVAATLPQQTHVLSPTTELPADDLVEQVQKRRESLILTDFPSASERPSLPVTPAPIRRSTFWGGEKDDESELPAAEGVPEQADWDPAVQLEQLRRNSLIGPTQLSLPAKQVADREMVPTAVKVEHAAQQTQSAEVGAPTQHALEQAEEQPYVPISGGSSPHGLLPLEPVTNVAIEAVPTKTTKAGSPTFLEPKFGEKAADQNIETLVSPTEQVGGG